MHGLLSRYGEKPLLALLPFATAAMVTVPLLYVLIASFSSGPPGDPDAHFTVANWINVYTSQAFLTGLWNSLVLGLVTALCSSVLGFAIAWIVLRTDTPGRRFFDLAMIFPLYMPPLILAMAWVALGSGRTGYLNVIWRRLVGAESGSLMDTYSFSGIVLVMVLHYVPHAYLILGSSIRSISGTLEEASRMCRARPWQTFRYVSVPILLPAFMASLVQVGVFAAEQFSVPFYLGISYGFETVPSQIFLSMSRFPVDYNEAAAAGTMLLWFTMSGIFMYRRLIQRANRYATIGGKGSRPARQRLGPWRHVTASLVALYLVLAVALPLLALAWGSVQAYIAPTFTFQNLSARYWVQLVGDPVILKSIRNSLILGLVGATVTVFFCLLVSFVSLRTKTLGRGVADYMAGLPVSVPGIVLGLGFLWFYVRSSLPLYGTLLGLGIAYGIRFMGHGVRMTSAGLIQIHTELIDAARACRAGTFRTIVDILLPLLRPSLVSAWMILFVLFLLELNVTILLYRAETITMSVYIWTTLDALSQHAAYPVSLLQAAIVFVVVFVATKLQGAQEISSSE